MVVVLGACSSATDGGPPSESATDHSEQSDDAGHRCLVEGGGVMTEKDGAVIIRFPGLEPEALDALREKCDPLFPPPVELTDEEIRATYDDWVGAAECLRSEGYTPAQPPPFEVFLADWRSTGPWSPIDGIDTNLWDDADYRRLKELCDLDMYDRF